MAERKPPDDGDNPLAALADLLRAGVSLVPDKPLPSALQMPPGYPGAGATWRDAAGQLVPQSGGEVAAEAVGGPAVKGIGAALAKIAPALAAILPAVVRANKTTDLPDLPNAVMRGVQAEAGTPDDYYDTLANILEQRFRPAVYRRTRSHRRTRSR